MPQEIPGSPVSVRSMLLSIGAGVLFFYLSDTARTLSGGIALPEAIKEFWYAHPLAGAWLIGALDSLAAHWLTGLVVGLALALAVRRDFWFYGAVATGAWLIMALQMRLDGWYALLQVGPSFWLALKIDALSFDPVGSLSAWLALPVCTHLWGRRLA